MKKVGTMNSILVIKHLNKNNNKKKLCKLYVNCVNRDKYKQFY